MLTRLIVVIISLVVIISQYMQIFNPYVVHLKLMLYINGTLIKRNFFKESQFQLQ